MVRLAALTFALLLVARGAHASGVGAARLLLVVGNDRPADATQALLRYADDDAVRYYERLEGSVEKRILLTRFDDESAIYRQLYPDVRPPTRAALQEALAILRKQALELRAQGRFVEFVFVFAGHGGRNHDGPYLALEGDRMSRQDLGSLVIDGVPADLTHVIIDACSAASFVEQRGPLRGERQALSKELLPFGSLIEQHPRAGFVIAASAGGSAFEWSRFGSGVASHLIRSGLSGAADMRPPDGRVTYDELKAYLANATAGLLPAEYKQDITVIAPRALPSAALIELQEGANTTELLIDRPGRWYLRDADGHRIIDLRTGRGTTRLILPGYSPRFALVQMREHGASCTGPGRMRAGTCMREDLVAELQARAQHRASKLVSTATTVAARGVIEDSVFEGLLAQPFEAEIVDRDLAPRVRHRDAQLPRPSLGLGYRGIVGTMMKELGPVHGLELRLELPAASWLVFAPVGGVGRGTATPLGSSEYAVYQFELGGELAWLAWQRPVVSTFGLEARVQVLDQSPPHQPNTIASVGATGLVARMRYPLNDRLSIGGGLAGGGRLGNVNGSLRARAYAALSVTVSGEL